MNIYICIVIMAAVTYAIRMLPLVIFKKPIRNRFFRSFLYYAPYVTLSVLIFPAILNCTGDTASSVVGFAVAVVTSVVTSSLPVTAVIACLSTFIVAFLK